MKPKLLFILLITFFLSGCDRENAVVPPELQIIQETSRDTNLFDFVRESAGRFSDLLFEKPGISRRQMFRAHWQMNSERNEATITTYVAFLKALEKKVPDNLPSVEIYVAMENKAGASEIIEYTLGQTVIMMSNSIQNITLYNDPSADAEVEGVLRRFSEKHGASDTGKKILELLNTVHGYGIKEREMGIKPWESHRRAQPGDVGDVNEAVETAD